MQRDASAFYAHSGIKQLPVGSRQKIVQLRFPRLMRQHDGGREDIVPQLDRGSSAGWERTRLLISARVAVSPRVETTDLDEIAPAKNPDLRTGHLFSA